jgi:hypothetical protein
MITPGFQVCLHVIFLFKWVVASLIVELKQWRENLSDI